MKVFQSLHFNRRNYVKLCMNRSMINHAMAYVNYEFHIRKQCPHYHDYYALCLEIKSVSFIEGIKITENGTISYYYSLHLQHALCK